MEKYELPKNRSHPFCIAFVYAKSGTKMVTGSEDEVISFLDNLELSHASITVYKRSGRKSFTAIVGGLSVRYGIIRDDARGLKQKGDLFPSRYRDWMMSTKDMMQLKKRKVWVLYEKIYDSHGLYKYNRVLRTFRKLPKSHLKELKV